MTTVRWILVAPLAGVAGVLVATALVMMLGPSEGNYHSPAALAYAVTSMAASAAAALLVAWAVAPSYRWWAVIAISAILIILNVLELWSAASALHAHGEAKDRIRIAEAIGFLSVAVGASTVGVLRSRPVTRPR